METGIVLINKSYRIAKNELGVWFAGCRKILDSLIGTPLNIPISHGLKNNPKIYFLSNVSGGADTVSRFAFTGGSIKFIYTIW
ncbi:hypothetical protein J1TS3_35030 [Siminovitchia fordii]|uniref:Uncharacterized protein n=1 Tax=Siminovitchia fordii TaxID=254759 RepID=A0ABQ4K9G5_9BACI|nr:hypothetical protein J1TS3_35030 [Siminovitchia fordii]